MKLKDFLSRICVDAVVGARAGTIEAVRFAERADELSVDVPVGGATLRSEGAGNLPSEIFLADNAKVTTGGYLEEGRDGELEVNLKRRLFESTPEFTVEIEFRRSKSLEGIEIARSRANEVNKLHSLVHRAKVYYDGKEIIIQEKNDDGTSDER